MAIRSRPPAPQLGRMPSLPGYGYLDDVPVYRDPVRIPDIRRTEPQFPDIVRAQFGAGDKNTVGALLRTVAGEDGGMTGVPPEYAAHLLQSFGYPTAMDALSADEWDQRIKANATLPNPLDMFGGY